MRKIIPVLVFLVFTLTACNLPALPVTGLNPVSAGAIWLTSDPNRPATATPFMPDASLNPTATPENVVEVTPNQEPTESVLKRPDQQVNILILGSDFRPGQGYRTDVFMLLSLYPKEGTASVISFPRDLYIYLPGIGNQRINVAQPFGGFELSKAVLEENFGVTADHYVMTNFQGFKGIINSLGGINVNVSQYLSDHCELPQGDANKNCTVYAGVNYMDGDTALWYVRSRYTTSDLDRTRRAQEVILAIFSKLMSLNAISRAPELYNLYINSVETDLTVSDILPLLPLATSILNDTSKLRRYAIGISEVTPTTLPQSGASVLLPDFGAIHQLILQSAYTP